MEQSLPKNLNLARLLLTLPVVVCYRKQQWRCLLFILFRFTFVNLKMTGTEDNNTGKDPPRVNMVVGAVHLRKYGKFVEEYVTKLETISERMKDTEVDIFGSDPVAVKINSDDVVSVIDVLSTDNKVLNKIVAVMAALCLEVRERVAEAQGFYNALLYFGDELDGNQALTATSKFLPRLQDLANFVERCQTVIGEFLQQLAAVYTISTNNQIINAENMHFEDMMQHLGDLLLVLVNLDALILSLEPLHETWALYKRLIPTVQLPGSSERIRSLLSIVNQLESSVLSAKMFRGAIDRLSGWRPAGSSLGDELQLYVKNMINSLELKENRLVQDCSALFLRTGCVLVLTASIFGLHDKRLMKQTWEVARRFPCVPLAGPCVWNPDEFFVQYLDHMLKPEDKRQAASLPNCRSDVLNRKCKNTVADLARFSQEVALWTIELDSLSDHSQLTLDGLKRRCGAFLGGAKLAGNIKRTIRLVMNIHAAQGKPMTRSVVIYLCGLSELLSAIARTYRMNGFQLAESVHHVVEFLAHDALLAVIRATQRLKADKACTKRHLDALSALLLAQDALLGPVTPKRLLVARLALSVARGAQARVLRDEEVR